jgi:RNA polymerase sigma-70 factor (ECF subfamily)
MQLSPRESLEEAGIRMRIRDPSPSDPPDEALMERYAHGDDVAFEELFRRYERRAFAYFTRRTRSSERARDLYQELFLRVHRARHAYDPTRDFAPWLFQIAHHLLIDDERRAYRSREVAIEESERNLPVARFRDALVAREELTLALAGLSEAERSIVLAVKGEGAGYAEVARQLGKSVDAVKKTASRALLRLRQTAPPAIFAAARSR